MKIDDEVAIRCLNTNCPSQLLRNLIHFSSKNAMDIDGLGESIITAMVNKKMIKSASDIYKLTKQDLLDMERMGEKSSKNILKSIENSKTRGLDKLLFGLGIRHVGQKAAKLISEKLENIDGIINASKEDISSIPGLGETVAESINLYFSLPQSIELIDDFKSLGISMYYKSNISNDKFKNMIFVLTGSLENYTRGEATEIIEKMGGKVTSSVSKNTSYVLVGDEPGSKVEKAQKLGVPLISEENFERMIKEKSTD